MRLKQLAPLGLAVALLLTGCGCDTSVISVTSVEISGSSASVSNPDYSVVSGSTSSSLSQPQTDSVLPKQLKLDVQKIYLTEGQTFSIGSVVYPVDALGKQLVWSSTDSAVASINNGVVKFENAGTATIAASTLLGELTQSCQVECVAVCDDIETLRSVLINALLSGENVYNVYLFNPNLLDNLTVDPVWGLFSADVKEKIYFVGDESMSEVYPVSFLLTPNFSSSCLKAVAMGNLSGLNELQAQTYAAAKKFVETHLSVDLSDYQKIKIIHDYIVKNGNLDTSTEQEAVYSQKVAYGILVGDIAISDGYADAFQLLSGLVGIETRVISGMVGSSRRVWNLVKLNDGWYHIDIVAADRADLTDGSLNYDYFLISDQRISATHNWNKTLTLNAPSDYIDQ